MQDVVLKGFEQIFKHQSVISISGESGTGKTSLALYLVSYLLIHDNINNDSSVLWIQAGEEFPKKRLISMYRDQKEKCDYLMQNTFIIPPKVISSYSEQNKFLSEIVDNKFLFPPDLKFIVIDNISHHLRFEISKVDDIRKRSSLLNDFYDTLLCPLILRCQRENIVLILLHEVSFNVKMQKTLPFFHSLYKRIKGASIYLSRSPVSNERKMIIEVGKKVASLFFQLNNNGFNFILLTSECLNRLLYL
ncbi:MAG: hypothetical protein ACFFG0_47020 [Candidatus Thorarchaeota archaeon]